MPSPMPCVTWCCHVRLLAMHMRTRGNKVKCHLLNRLLGKFRAGNAFPWLSRIWRGPAPSKVFRPTAASWSGTMSTDSSGSSSASDSDDQTQPDDGGDRQQSSDGSDDSTAPPKVQVTVNSGSPNRAARQRYGKKHYHRPYTPGDVSSYSLFFACRNYALHHICA